MPKLNGIETINQILSLYPRHSLPKVIIQTSSPESIELQEFVTARKEQDCHCVLLSKPIKQHSLQQTIWD